MLFMLYDTPTTAPCELLLCIQYCVLYPVGCDLIFLLRLTSKHPCAHYLSFNLTSTFSYFFGQARLEVKRGKKYCFSVSCVMLYYLLLLRTPICSLSDPSQKVLFGRPFAKFWPLNPVEMDTFFSLNKFVTICIIEAQEFWMENISYWGHNIDLKYSRGRANSTF